jgi:hypothetical protein
MKNWNPLGLLTLDSEMVELFEAVDSVWLRFFDEWQPRRFRFPTLMSLSDLNRAQGLFGPGHLKIEGSLSLCPLSTLPFFVHFQDRELAHPTFATACVEVSRPIQNAKAFMNQMQFFVRELVIVGTSTEVEAFHTAVQGRADVLLGALGLKGKWRVAENSAAPAGLATFGDLLEPPKRDYFLNETTALVSLRAHGQRMAKAFGLTIAGEPAFTASLGVGLERLMGALWEAYGPRRELWPEGVREVLEGRWEAAAMPME